MANGEVLAWFDVTKGKVALTVSALALLIGACVGAALWMDDISDVQVDLLAEIRGLRSDLGVIDGQSIRRSVVASWAELCRQGWRGWFSELEARNPDLILPKTPVEQLFPPLPAR